MIDKGVVVVAAVLVWLCLLPLAHRIQLAIQQGQYVLYHDIHTRVPYDIPEQDVLFTHVRPFSVTDARSSGKQYVAYYSLVYVKGVRTFRYRVTEELV